MVGAYSTDVEASLQPLLAVEERAPGQVLSPENAIANVVLLVVSGDHGGSFQAVRQLVGEA